MERMKPSSIQPASSPILRVFVSFMGDRVGRCLVGDAPEGLASRVGRGETRSHVAVALTVGGHGKSGGRGTRSAGAGGSFALGTGAVGRRVAVVSVESVHGSGI